MSPLEQIAARLYATSDPRHGHIAATLRQLDSLVKCDLSMAELGAAYETLALRTTADPRIEARRKTCKELSAICRELDQPLSAHGYPDACLRAGIMWGLWAAHITGEDPRSAAMRDTLLRESQQLRNEAQK